MTDHRIAHRSGARRRAEGPGHRSAHRARGFTLIELIIAMGAGLMVSMATVLLAKSATAFFQWEARISSAQLAATLGLSRLTNELRSAAFLGTRSILLDTKLCTTGVTLPSSLSTLTGLQITLQGSMLAHPTDLAQSTSTMNNLDPDSIVISGSLYTQEMFTVNNTLVSGGVTTLTLRTGTDEAMFRIRATAAAAGQTLLQGLTPIIVPGRFMRLKDDSGFIMWGIIQTLSVVGTAPNETVTVTLASTPQLPNRNSSPGAVCGITGQGRQLLASVVTRVKYDLRSLATNAFFAQLVAPNAANDAVTGQSGRTELIRVELDQNGNEITSTLQLVAELAVDLKFGVTKAPMPGALTYNPTMTTYAFDDPNVPTRPDLVRAIQVRLATRARVPDRQTPLTVSGRLHHFGVLAAPIKPNYSRLRTLYTNVWLPNQKDFS